MIELAHIQLRRGDRLVFEDLDLRVHAGHRIGVVGRNGAGKSSLFALLRGVLQPELGDVRVPPRWTIGYMAQESEPSAQPAIRWVEAGDARLARIRTALADAERRDDHDAQARLHGEFEDADGYTLEARAGEILSGLGFSADDAARAQQEFSGGWRIRLNLARTLMTRADLLLLDEPTNHLDIDALLWLEAWLKRFDGTLMIIAHDRDFLDATTDYTAHLEGGRATVYRGGYSAFERQRAEHLAQQEALARVQRREAAHMQAFVDRFRAIASKARQVQSRIKALERMGQTAVAQVDSPYRFQFPNPERMSRFLIETEDATFGYPTRTVIEHARFLLAPGERLGVLGSNGAGKTTFIKTIAGELDVLTGELKRGMHSKIGYFAQHQLERLDLDSTPLGEMQALEPDGRQQLHRNHLGGWGFPGTMVTQRTRTLSGGEKARLVLALIAWQRPAVLLLDEPTNHLDLDMRHALAASLTDYSGAVVVVSHDREFMARTVDDYWMVENGRIEPYRGDMATYVERIKRRQSGAAPAQDIGRRPSSRRERRQAAAGEREKTRVLRKALADLERKLERASAELREIRTRLADTDTYQRLPREELEALLSREGTLARTVAETEAAWLDRQSDLEAAASASAQI